VIKNTKCECGHQNPAATLLCESCGKPLQEAEEARQTPLEMKYDGVARRSQKENPGMLDRVWSFFSSVRVAIYLIVITLVLSTLGTIYPQENTFVNLDASTYYKETYGTAGHLYYLLGLSHTYESWWFLTLLFMIGTSLVVCSLDRVLPLYRALSKQQIRKHHSFIQRQKVTVTVSLPGLPEEGASPAEWVSRTASLLKKKGYRIYNDPEGTALLAEKNRFSRWGPYVNHIGLIVFLAAVLMRSIPGWHMDQYIGFPEGEPVKIPETPYYLMNEQFTVEFYEQNPSIPKLFETKAVLYTCSSDCDDPVKPPVLTEVHKQNIIVNKPLSYKGLLAYQFDFKETPMLLSVSPSLRNKETGEAYGAFELSMFRPQPQYTAGSHTLELRGYFPDFALDDKGQPVTKSKEPRSPAFIFLIKGPGLSPNGEVYMYFPKQVDKERYRQDELNGDLASRLELTVGNMENVKISAYTSYLNIRKDKAMPYIWTGAAISMIGLIMGFYWQHRRIWLRVDDGVLALGAHTNKNWFGLRKECAAILSKSGIATDPKSLERGGKGS
jgi:cytochrome c biogenesis protein